MLGGLIFAPFFDMIKEKGQKTMKKILVILLSVFLVFTLVGCNKTNFYDLEEEYVTAESRGLSFKAEKEIYTAEDTVINYTIQNNTDEMQPVGNNDHWLHYKTEDGWKRVNRSYKNKKNVKYAITLENTVILPGGSGTFKINLSRYKLPLEKGEYRIERYGMVSESFFVE